MYFKPRLTSPFFRHAPSNVWIILSTLFVSSKYGFSLKICFEDLHLLIVADNTSICHEIKEASISNGRLRSFADLHVEFHLSNQMLFHYLQLRHVVPTQIPDAFTLESDSLEPLLTTMSLGKTLSSIFLRLAVAHSVKLIYLI